MTAPRQQAVQISHQNPDAKDILHIPFLVTSNTGDEVLKDQIRTNAARDDLTWLEGQPENDLPAIMVGGGATAADFISEIRYSQSDYGGKIFAMNAASKWLRSEGIEADYQCILDAQKHTSVLVDNEVPLNIIASQAHPDTMNAASNPLIWHLQNREGNIEDDFPRERVERGGYCLLAGGASCGNSAMAVAYALGHREFLVFGYDCSFRGKNGHAYEQGMNDLIPTTEMEWDGKKYTLSVAMKGQLMAFQIMATELKRLGCTIEMYGDALLQHIYRTDVDNMTERDKYRSMWNVPDYRNVSPGEGCVKQFLELVKPDGLILDFGCGTGRASLALYGAGHRSFLIDFADNCRDQEALNLPFLEWDLTSPLPMTAEFGFCCDVMEHLPTDQVDVVIANIMDAASTTYFQISTLHDYFGGTVSTSLHLTVRPAGWWAATFENLGYEVTWQERDARSCRLIVTKNQPSDQKEK